MAVSGRESPSEQHYSLKWNDYSVKLVTAFQSLRDEEDFVDVTVACDGHQYSAHKMVLSACSPYFRAMLRANPCQHPIVILKDVGHNEMERLLEFMYNGEVNIAQDQLAAFLRTAENLKIRGLAGSSDDMEQIYNRDYGNISTSDKLYNQQLQQQNSTSVSAIPTSNTSSSSHHNEHNHQGMMSNNGFAKEEGDGLSLSGGGLSVTTADCYSPAPKKRKLVMLDNTDQDCITDGDMALDGSGDANSVAALVSQAGPLGVEVKCLSRDLKAEPCEAGAEAGLTGGGEAVYSSGAGGDDQASHDQLIAPHLYTIGVGGSTGMSGGATHQDLGSAAQHNDQGAVAGCEALNLSVRPHHNQRPPPPPHHREGGRQHHHHHHYERYQHHEQSPRQHFSGATAAVVMTGGSGSSNQVHHGGGTNQDLRVVTHLDHHHHHATRSGGHHRLRPVLIATSHTSSTEHNHHQQQQHVDANSTIAFSSSSSGQLMNQHLTVLNLPREDEGEEAVSAGAINCPVRGRQQQPALGRPLHHLQPYHVSPPGRTRQLVQQQPSREVSPTGLVYRVKLEYPEPKQEYLDPDDSTPMDLGAPVAARTLMSGARDHHHHQQHHLSHRQLNSHHEPEHGDPGGGDEDDGHLHHHDEDDSDTVASDGSNALLLRSSSADLNESAKSTLSAINSILSAEMMDQRVVVGDNDLKLPLANSLDIDGSPNGGLPYGGGANNGTGRSPGGGGAYRSGGGGGGPGKVYPCSECHKVFRHPMSLHHHRHVHRGTYTCQSCSKVFSRRWDLHRHLHRSKLGCRRPSAGGAAPAGGGDATPVVVVTTAGGPTQQVVHMTNSRGDAVTTEAVSYEDEMLLRNGHQTRPGATTGEGRGSTVAAHSLAAHSTAGSSVVLTKNEHQGNSNSYSSALIVSVKSSSSLAAATNTIGRHPHKQWHHQQKQLEQNAAREDQGSKSSPKMEYDVDDGDGDQCSPNSSDSITSTVNNSNGHYSRPSNAAAALHHNPSSSCSPFTSSTPARPAAAASAAAACSASYAAANRASCGGGGGLSPPTITPSSSGSGAASLPPSSSLTTGPSN